MISWTAMNILAYKLAYFRHEPVLETTVLSSQDTFILKTSHSRYSFTISPKAHTHRTNGTPPQRTKKKWVTSNWPPHNEIFWKSPKSNLSCAVLSCTATDLIGPETTQEGQSQYNPLEPGVTPIHMVYAETLFVLIMDNYGHTGHNVNQGANLLRVLGVNTKSIPI